ncbi:MAG: hypothetical protein M1482_15890, partial [Chloroflexi bacterium]|nr:hypothetical protein [Chloroflexota bacterium]
MGLDSLLAFVTQGTLVLIAALTLLDLVRHRVQARLDTALMFGSLAAYVLLLRVPHVNPTMTAWTGLLAGLCLLAQPYLALRLVDHLTIVARPIHAAALAGLLLSWLIAVVAPVTPLVAVVVAYFVAVESYDAYAFVRGAQTTSGATHRRLELAATGSGIVALVILLLGVDLIAPAAATFVNPVIQLLAVPVVLAYYCAFAPPRWLRRAWQLDELYRFLRERVARQAHKSTQGSLFYLCEAAARAAGASAAAAALWDQDQKQLRVHASVGLPPEQE